MKCLLVLLSLAVLAWSQGENECDCEVVLKFPNETISVDDLPVNGATDCDDHSGCMKTCRDEWDSVSNGGDLNYIQSNGKTVGQNLCDSLALEGQTNLEPTKLHLDYSLCNGEWHEEGTASHDTLCCVDGVYPGSC
ncbi:uncharacterized protein [Procambarus clarkii]|uniref:uncharacterized protein n=1 Tax=Procambarus clarkii TaxID=6728 RepID=UPI001E677E1A|nr:uncharacterized protein LOC123762823 [Procambarus clarkii]